jgi:large repetitive protein
METQCSAKRFGMIKLSAVLFAGLACFLLGTLPASAGSLTIDVVGVAADGSLTPLDGTMKSYRWTVEEDATKASIPGLPADTSNYSFSMHTSYMPVVAAGRSPLAQSEMDSTQFADPDVERIHAATPPEVCPSTALPPSPCIDPSKRYYVSVAAVGFQMGGAPVVFNADGTASATVYVNEYDLPPAQLSVFVFNDNNPINGAPDLPQETGLAGFHVHLIEAGGTYGDSGGEVTQDAFGNPLGTTYSDAAGTVATRGTGIFLTDANGVVRIKNLYPAKYTIYVDPPTGSDWHQTSTIEGTRGDDAWVKNNEPTFFQEFGPPGHHVFVGFTRSGSIAMDGTPPMPVVPAAVGSVVTGRVVETHNSRPPVFTFFNGAPVNDCWVGLNEPAGRALYATRCSLDSTFTIPNVPNGTYELVVWDDPLDMIIGTSTITVDGSTPLALGDVPVSSWFGRYEGRVFQDIDGTGVPFFLADFNRPHIEIDRDGIEHEVITPYHKGDLKPSFGDGIASNIRFRDGSIYQSRTTKTDGTFAFTEVFPFFNFMVGEIDYARWKASGATVVVDDGGQIDDVANATKLWPTIEGLYGSQKPAWQYNPWTRLNPQQQDDCSAAQVLANREGGMLDGNPIDAKGCLTVGPKYFRTENCDEGDGQCAILLEAMQTFLGQTNHIEWGKQPYAGELNGRKGENGGIAGIVHYAITRAEEDPRYAAAEQWEPGVPRVQVNMYLDCDGDTFIDKPSNDGTGQCAQLSSDTSYVATDGSSLPLGGYKYDPADVDNYPYCWSSSEFASGNPGLCTSGQAMGPEDIKRSRTGGTLFSLGDVFLWGSPEGGAQPEMGYGHTDSWDDSIPRGCPDQTPYYVPGTTTNPLDCFDGLRNFNQVRPAVFDGGYAFGRVAGQPELPMYIGAEGAGTYIVEAIAPPGYLHQGNGDLNVVFGDSLKSTTAALPFECVGQELPVPSELTLFPGETNPNAEAGQATWRKCDMKAVSLVPGTNPAPDFWLFTEAPVAGHGVGFILDDTTAEFNYYSPNFGEKYAPPHMPISIQDWTGREISRVYSDEYGSYNFLVPSSFTINPPYPSGVMPSMVVACMNHPGPIKVGVNPDGSDKMGVDPFFNRSYSQFCYTLQYLAGKTTYLDTPVVPVAAFANVNANPLDCDCADGTPMIYSANHGTDDGPWVPTGGPAGTRRLTILSVGTVDVLNPKYDPADTINPASQLKTIKRDYGFGDTQGTVSLTNNSTGGGVTVVPGQWSNGMIVLQLPSNGSTGQLMITRANGKQSVVGLTVHRPSSGEPAPLKVSQATGSTYTTIQAAIDAAVPGQLITIAPGVYKEYVIMDKRVRLQGWGSGSVFINAAKSTTATLAEWRARLNAKIDPQPDGTINPDTGQPNVVPGPARTFDLVPGQALGFNPSNNEPLLFGAEEGPGVLILGKAGNLGNTNTNDDCSGNQEERVDGLTITGSDAGGAILVNGYACNAQLTNNRIVSNYGTYGGGIRIGHTVLTTITTVPDGTDTIAFSDAVNRSPTIRYNWISQNGATEAGGGGGITLGTGANGYTVADNYVCGNFSMADGGGLSHLGRSAGTLNTSGGNAGTVGSANLISHNKFIFNQTFNQSSDPMGGGVSIAAQIPAVAGGVAEGTGDVLMDGNLVQNNQSGAGAGGGVSIARTGSGDDVLLTNNMIVNNMTAYRGGGVALTANGSGVRLVNNTVANNVSTATNRQSFGASGPAAPSVPQVAGLSVLSGANPLLLNNIAWANRSYIYLISGTHSALCDPGTMALVIDPVTGVATCGAGSGAQYRDLSAGLTPRYSVLTTGGFGNAAYLTGTSGCGPNSPSTGTGFLCNREASAASTTLFVKKNDFDSIVDPSQPVILQDQTVYVQPALTFDETANFVNVIMRPLTLWDEVINVATGAVTSATLRADYHLANAPGGAPAVDNGRSRATGTGGTSGATNAAIGTPFVPGTDYDGQSRPGNNPNPVDIGADER